MTKSKDKITEHGVLEKIISGALRSSINVHGPITKDNTGSAAKRAACQIRAEIKRLYLEDP